MRSLPGTRNRIVLVLAGVLTLAAAAWLLAVAFGPVPAGQALDGVLAPGETTVAELAQQYRGWLLPTASVAAVLAVLVGLALLLAQVPTAPPHTPLRLHDGDTLLATLEPQVLERALAERAEGVPGVDGASLRVAGSTSALTVQAEVTVSDTAEVEWAVAEVRRVLMADLETALGTPPRAVDLLVRLRTPRSSARGDRSQVAVRQEDRDDVVVPESV